MEEKKLSRREQVRLLNRIDLGTGSSDNEPETIIDVQLKNWSRILL